MKKHGFKVLLLIMLAIALITSIVACDKKTFYTLSFETNGGEGIESVKVEQGETYALPAPSERANFVFEGWYLDESLEGDPVSEVTMNGDTTVYAKWSTAYALTLKISDSQTQVVYLKSGQALKPVLDGVQTADPSGYIFGAWFMDGKEIEADMVMPAYPISLEARYKVHFTSSVSLEQPDGSYKASDSIEGYGYVGDLPTIVVKGYKVDRTVEGTVYKELVSDPAANSFEVFMTSHGFILTVEANCPEEGYEIEDYRNEKLDYGQTVDDLPLYGIAGSYIMIGWSRDKDAEKPEWESPIFYKNLYNKDGAKAPESYVVSEDDVTLYGVWLKGATDIFGGNDIVYLMDDGEEPYVYVWRSGKFFKAEYYPTNGDFVVRNADNQTSIDGRLNSDGTFSYTDSSRRTEGNYFLYRVGPMDGKGPIDNNVTIVVDDYNGITYTDLNLESDRVSIGTYVLDEDGNYVATFGEGGPLSEQKVTIFVGQTTNNTRVFALRNEDDIALGEVYRHIGTSLYYPIFTFDGFFTATYTTGGSNSGSTGNYYYTRISDDEIWVASDINGFSNNNYLVLKLDKIEGTEKEQTVYSFYYENLDHTYKEENGVEELTLDGESSAQYKGRNYVFMTAGTSSALGGTLVELYSNSGIGGLTRTYLLNVYTKTIKSEDGGDPQYEYYFRELDYTKYAELARLDSLSGNIVRDYMLVFNDEYNASLYRTSYMFNMLLGVELIAKGTYDVANSDNNTYKFTVDQDSIGENGSADIGIGQHLEDVEYFEFGMASSSSQQLFYYVAYKLNDQAEVRYDKVYTAEEGDGVLTIIGTAKAGFATYSTGGRVYSGNYQTQDFIFILTYADAAETHTLYLQLNDNESGDNTYSELSLPLGKFYEYTHGVINRDNYLTFDGKGGATLYEKDKPIEGKFEESKDFTLFADLEAHYMTFTSNDNTLKFNYVFASVSDYTYFVRYESKASGTFTQISAEEGESLDAVATLQLDGYYIAKYTPDNSDETKFIYAPYSFDAETNAVRITLTVKDEKYYAYFDLKDGNTFTERGSEYTDLCLLYDNARLKIEVSFKLDGYGNLTVLDIDGNEAGKGKYKFDENGALTFTYALDSAPDVTLTQKGQLGTVSISGVSFPALLVDRSTLEGTYVVTDDLTVLTLDRFNNALFVNKMGLAYRAMYQIVDDNFEGGKVLIFFTGVNTSERSTSKNAGLFVIDKAAGTVTAVEYDKTYSYYDANLSAMQFSKTGYLYIDAELAFYTVAANGNVTIYRTDDGANANAYGFEKDTSFGALTREGDKNFGGKTYHYNEQEGFDIHFKRDGANADQYPLEYLKGEDKATAPIDSLYFTPSYSSNSANFTVYGTISFKGDDKTYACSVIRRVDPDDPQKIETYISVDDGLYGYYRFDINIRYNGGANNTFEITRMRRMVEMNSFDFEYTYWMIYIMYGASFANQLEDTIGGFRIEAEYNADGSVEKDKFYGNFGKDADITDSMGNPLDMSECDYKFEQIRLGYYVMPCYAVTVKGADGCTYVVRFAPQEQRISASAGFTGYLVAFISRVDEFTFAATGSLKACTLTMETIVYAFSELSSYGVVSGRYYDAKIVYDGEEYTPTYFLDKEEDGVTYKLLVVRQTSGEEDSDRIVTAKYFKFDLKTKKLEDGAKYTIPQYESSTSSLVSVETCDVLYSADGSQWVDYNKDTHEIKMFCYNRVIYVVKTCTYDPNSNTVTLTYSADGPELVVAFGEDGISITEQQ